MHCLISLRGMWSWWIKDILKETGAHPCPIPFGKPSEGRNVHCFPNTGSIRHILEPNHDQPYWKSPTAFSKGEIKAKWATNFVRNAFRSMQCYQSIRWRERDWFHVAIFIWSQRLLTRNWKIFWKNPLENASDKKFKKSDKLVCSCPKWPAGPNMLNCIPNCKSNCP